MQLVMLAPASNLATSVTAALMPTLLGPAASMATNKTFLPGNFLYAAELFDFFINLFKETHK